MRPALQFDGARAASVAPAPLLNEHGEAIRGAIARGEAWPAAAQSARPVRHKATRVGGG